MQLIDGNVAVTFGEKDTAQVNTLARRAQAGMAQMLRHPTRRFQTIGYCFFHRNSEPHPLQL
jgi:hypothetical protein